MGEGELYMIKQFEEKDRKNDKVIDF